MGGLIRGFLRLVLFAWFAAWVGGTIGAISVKRRTVANDDPAADEVVLVAVYGPLEFASTARAFRGGTVETWYGGGTIDLRGAVLHPDGADLSVRAVFGGGQIIVPDSWQVTTTVRGLGGIADARPGGDQSPGGPVLRIDATTMFGGFGITSVGPERDGVTPGAAWDRAPVRPS